MTWQVIRTSRFSEEFKTFEKKKEFVEALDKKIKRLGKDPNLIAMDHRRHDYERF